MKESVIVFRNGNYFIDNIDVSKELNDVVLKMPYIKGEQILPLKNFVKVILVHNFGGAFVEVKYKNKKIEHISPGGIYQAFSCIQNFKDLTVIELDAMVDNLEIKSASLELQKLQLELESLKKEKTVLKKEILVLSNIILSAKDVSKALSLLVEKLVKSSEEL